MSWESAWCKFKRVFNSQARCKYDLYEIVLPRTKGEDWCVDMYDNKDDRHPSEGFARVSKARAQELAKNERKGGGYAKVVTRKCRREDYTLSYQHRWNVEHYRKKYGPGVKARRVALSHPKVRRAK